MSWQNFNQESSASSHDYCYSKNMSYSKTSQNFVNNFNVNLFITFLTLCNINITHNTSQQTNKYPLQLTRSCDQIQIERNKIHFTNMFITYLQLKRKSALKECIESVLLTSNAVKIYLFLQSIQSLNIFFGFSFDYIRKNAVYYHFLFQFFNRCPIL